MPIVKNARLTAILAGASLLLSAGLTIADNNVVSVTAEITKGNCEFSTSIGDVEFSSQTINSFSPGNAAAVMPLKLLYECDGYLSGEKMGVFILTQASADSNVLLSSTSTATGVGFMLKEGEVTETAGFYNAGTTLKNGGKFIIDMAAEGEHTLSVGFVKQNNATAVKAGDAKASVTFMFVMP